MCIYPYASVLARRLVRQRLTGSGACAETYASIGLITRFDSYCEILRVRGVSGERLRASTAGHYVAMFSSPRLSDSGCRQCGAQGVVDSLPYPILSGESIVRIRRRNLYMTPDTQDLERVGSSISAGNTVRMDCMNGLNRMTGWQIR